LEELWVSSKPIEIVFGFFIIENTLGIYNVKKNTLGLLKNVETCWGSWKTFETILGLLKNMLKHLLVCQTRLKKKH